MTATHIR